MRRRLAGRSGPLSGDLQHRRYSARSGARSVAEPTRGLSRKEPPCHRLSFSVLAKLPSTIKEEGATTAASKCVWIAPLAPCLCCALPSTCCLGMTVGQTIHRTSLPPVFIATRPGIARRCHLIRFHTRPRFCDGSRKGVGILVKCLLGALPGRAVLFDSVLE